MRLTLVCIILQVFLAHSLVSASPRDGREVTNTDIRDAILSLVHMFRSSEDKLERHELRERGLGEQLKKALAALDKRHRALEPIKGVLGRLDERVSNVETILMQREEKERVQQEKLRESLTKMETNVQTLISNVEKLLTASSSDVRPPREDEVAEQITDLGANMSSKMDEIKDKVYVVAKELEDMKERVGKSEEKAEKLADQTSQHLENTSKKMHENLNQTESILNTLESRLNEIKGADLSTNSHQWQKTIISALEKQSNALTDLRVIKDQDILLPSEGAFLTQNSTLDAIQDLKDELLAVADKGVSKLTMRIGELQDSVNNELEYISKAISESDSLSETMLTEVSKNYKELKDDMQGLADVERVMLQTADNVLATKRSIEYGVQQVVLEVTELVKMNTKSLNGTVNDRFDAIEDTMLDTQTGALANLSSTLKNEMSQVWRQIGIMYMQLTTSNEALDRLQAQTELYVNGSLSTMDNMEGKVGQITGRMAEVDENLNYLLGRLSLVTQEFNQIKIGLGSALDNIRTSFLTVQEKIKDVGPGPHKIPDAENNEDLENSLTH